MNETGSGRKEASSFRDAYQEVMDRVRVTEGMRVRVLSAVAEKREGSAKISFFRTPVGRILPLLAAAAVIFALYAAVLPGAWRSSQGSSQGETEPAVAEGFYAEEKESLSALSDAAGYPVRTLTGLPFAVSDTAYTYYSDGMAQITWTGTDGESCTFRMAEGTGDVSGDYTDYKEEKTVTLFSQEVTLSGAGDGTYTLATWTDGTYSYSISLTKASGSGYLPVDWEKLALQ